jgi:TRAP-type mannitol/chloroaromatic compound transport system permease small subunit
VTTTTMHETAQPRGRVIDLALRGFGLSVVAIMFAFLVNNYLSFWRGWPGLSDFFAHQGWFGGAGAQMAPEAVSLGWIQLAIYLVALAAAIGFVLWKPERGLHDEAGCMRAMAAYIVRAAFWAVFLVGIADALISFLRIEGFLEQFVGVELTNDLGQSRYRGNHVHYPLVLLSLVIAYFSRSLGFIWLAALVVVAEMLIVIARFIFSYEQAFMGDLVRFWYAALFLFASAYNLIEEGHVRVDVLYTGFGARGKAWANTIGSALLGLPLCWVILSLGMRGKASVINSPLLAYETTQSGFGMYVKYLMAGFLAVFAVSMMIQFVGYFLSNAAELRGEVRDESGRHPTAAEPAS